MAGDHDPMSVKPISTLNATDHSDRKMPAKEPKKEKNFGQDCDFKFELRPPTVKLTPSQDDKSVSSSCYQEADMGRHGISLDNVDQPSRGVIFNPSLASSSDGSSTGAKRGGLINKIRRPPGRTTSMDKSGDHMALLDRSNLTHATAASTNFSGSNNTLRLNPLDMSGIESNLDELGESMMESAASHNINRSKNTDRFRSDASAASVHSVDRPLQPPQPSYRLGRDQSPPRQERHHHPGHPQDFYHSRREPSPMRGGGRDWRAPRGYPPDEYGGGDRYVEEDRYRRYYGREDDYYAPDRYEDRGRGPPRYHYERHPPSDYRHGDRHDNRYYDGGHDPRYDDGRHYEPRFDDRRPYEPRYDDRRPHDPRYDDRYDARYSREEGHPRDDRYDPRYHDHHHPRYEPDCDLRRVDPGVDRFSVRACLKDDSTYDEPGTSRPGVFQAAGRGQTKDEQLSVANKPVYVEVFPGVTERLRRTQETKEAVESDFISPAVCFACDSDIFCIADVKYFICPTCKCVSLLEDDGASVKKSTGARKDVGIGFGLETLFKMQAEIVRHS